MRRDRSLFYLGYLQVKLGAEPSQRRLELLQDLGRQGEASVDVLAVSLAQERQADGKRQAAPFL